MFPEVPPHVVLELELLVADGAGVLVAVVVLVHVVLEEVSALERLHADLTCVVVVVSEQVLKKNKQYWRGSMIRISLCPAFLISGVL